MYGAWDLQIFHAINRGPESWTPSMRWVSLAIDEWPVRLVLLVFVIALAWRPATRIGGLLAAFGWPIANEATDWIKAWWPTPRPGNVLTEAIVRVGMADTSGTASAHSANMMFVAAVFVWYFRWWGVPWLALALLVGYSRVFLAAHTPLQVLFGWGVGIFMAASAVVAVEAILRGIRRRRAPARPAGGPPATAP